MLDEDDPYWRGRARRALTHHGLEPDPAAVEQTIEAMFEAHLDGAGMALDGRSPITLETARQAAIAPARPITNGARASPALRSPEQTGGPHFEAAAERYVRERQRNRDTAWTAQTEVQHGC